MRFLWRLIKYLLRSAFSIIIFLLLVGWAKMNRDMKAYISFLDTTDRSVFHRSQPATRSDPFRPATQQSTGDIADALSDDSSAETSGLDVYDPSFEEDLNSISDSSLSGDGDFWFTTDGQAADTHESASKSELLNIIKERELTK